VIFVVLAFGVGGIVIAQSVNRETVDSFLNADKRFLLAAFGLVAAAWCCDAGRFCALAKAAGVRVTFGLGIILTWLHYFGCAVTPMQSGGGPFQVYVLYKKDVPVGKGIAITMLRTMLTVFILTLVVPAALRLDPSLLDGSPFVKGVVTYVFTVIMCTWAFIGYTIARPASIKRVGDGLLAWLAKRGAVKPAKVNKYRAWLDREVDNYSMNFKLTFSTGLGYSLAALLLSALHLLCLFSVLPVLMLAVGLPFSFVQTVFTQAVFMFVLYFIPTPGASGVAESGGAFLFGTLMPWNMAGIMAIIWRFFTEYISIFMGVVVVIKMLGWGVSEELVRGAKKTEETEEKRE
jgi:uncharacterized protein (TIRG00374 family)